MICNGGCVTYCAPWRGFMVSKANISRILWIYGANVKTDKLKILPDDAEKSEG